MLTMDSLGLFLLIFTILFGLAIGSFLNVVIYRLPRHESLVRPASHCPSCNKPIKWFDNIPVLSFLVLGGKCRNCKTKISIVYPLIEILNTVFWVICLYRFGMTFETLFSFAFSSLLLTVSVIDIKTYEILDSSWIAILILAVCRTVLNVILKQETVGSAVLNLIIGALSGSVLFLIIYFIFLKVAKKEVIGGGDVKLTFACGAFVGWKSVLFGIGLSAYIGLLVIIILVICRKFKADKALPFGPFLALGFWIGYLYFDKIATWYLTTFAGL